MGSEIINCQRIVKNLCTRHFFSHRFSQMIITDFRRKINSKSIICDNLRLFSV